MESVPRVTAARYLGGYALELTFSTGEKGVVDYAGRVAAFRGMMEPLRDPTYFAQARVDPDTETVVWPNGVDACPTLLYHLATGNPIPEPERQTTASSRS